MRKITKTLAVVLSLSMTLTMGTPVFAEGTADSSNTVTTVAEAPVVTPTPAQENKPPKTGFYKKAGKTYYYKNGKLVKNKYGYKNKIIEKEVRMDLSSIPLAKCRCCPCKESSK